MIPLAAGYQHFADGAPFAEIALRHPSVKEVYFPWVGEPSGRPKLGFEEEDDPEELAAALKRDLTRLRAAGVRLDLLLNANCYGAEAMSVALEKRIAAIVEKLDSWGCRPEVCTTASPFVARTLKATAPDIEVRASVNMRLTTLQRFQDFPIDKMIYVVGNEQNYHFQVLSILLDKLGFKWGKDLVHFSYGMVELPNGKMKSREGTVVDADDLMAAMIADAYEASKERVKQTEMPEEEAREVARKVGLGALKYFILKVDARKNMLFNPEESIDFNGNTGPFIQYTYARIASILRKANEQGVVIPAQLSTVNCQLSTKETELIQKLSQFPVAVRQAGTDYSPSGICNYCYELTKAFNQFYHDFTILGETDEILKLFRLSLAKAVAKVISLGMGLLGIEMPERM